MTASPTNGKQEAIDNLKEDVKEIFRRLHDVETKGCLYGAYTMEKVNEMKNESKSIQRMLWIILLVLAATQGPQVISLLIKGF